jgi:hypothetical protein
MNDDDEFRMLCTMKFQWRDGKPMHSPAKNRKRIIAKAVHWRKQVEASAMFPVELLKQELTVARDMRDRFPADERRALTRYIETLEKRIASIN